MILGELAWDRILDQARELEQQGGAPVPAEPAGLADLAVSGHAEIFAVSRHRTADSGGMVLSSGGTTGSPKVAFVAYHQAIDRLLARWRPLESDTLLLNLFTPGRMWASHYYMQTLAERVGCDVLPSGPLDAAELPAWLDTFSDLGVTALAGTPTALTDLAVGVLDTGKRLDVHRIIWMGEPWTDAALATVRDAFPDARLWGNYGAVETYVIATNTPVCDLRVLHLMPDQVLELDDAGALLTRAGAGWTVPTVRYRLGDRLAPAECRCGRPDGLRVLGRADDAIKLSAGLFSTGELLDLTTALPGVRAAQLVLTRETEYGHVVHRIAVHYTGTANPEDVRAGLLAGSFRLRGFAKGNPAVLDTVRVQRLTRAERTNKVPPVLWRRPS